jgi:hypothetical protein
MVISPKKKHFLIDVKGLAKRNPWLVKRKKARRGLYYVLAYVPFGEPNQFFILSQKHANNLVAEHFRRPSKRKRPGWDGFGFDAPITHKGNWGLLPA